MNKLTISCLSVVFVSVKIYAQLSGSIFLNAGVDQFLPCSTTCTTLSAQSFQVGSTSSYAVSAIPTVAPAPYTGNSGTIIPFNDDNTWSNVIVLPFTFCYFGVTYTNFKVGPNGAIKFNPTLGYGNQALTNADCPSPLLINAGDVFGVYQDLDPSAIPSPNSLGSKIRYDIIGVAPNRLVYVSYNEMPQKNCASTATQMIVLYETTNVIDVYVQKKPLCTLSNLGSSIIGIQDPSGSAGIVAPNRNASPNWSVTTPEAWRFLPSGSSIVNISWFNGATNIGNGASINVCPTTVSTTYTCKATYLKCNGTTIVIQDNIVVNFDALPSPILTTTNESCNNYNNGEVTIDNPVGAGPYLVSLSGTATGAFNEANSIAAQSVFSNLQDGSYNYTVIGNHGCTTNGTFSIGSGGNCCSVIVNPTPINCNGNVSGSVLAVPSNVLTPITYSWTSNASTSQTLSNLAAGSYTVTTVDASGCIATSTGIVTEPLLITASTVQQNPTCSSNCDGSITVSATGGTGSLQYKLNFSGTYSNSNIFTSLCAGNYIIYVKDENNCVSQTTLTLAYPTPIIVFLINSLKPTCGANNGSISVSALGGSGTYTFSLNSGTNQASGNFTNLSPQIYQVRAFDQFGCFGNLEVTLNSNGSLVASVLTQANVSCFSAANGEVLIGVSGGTSPFTYVIDNGTPQTSNSFVGLQVGAHAVAVTDQSGCTSNIAFAITQPSQLSYTAVATATSCFGECTGSILFNASGGTSPYTYATIGIFSSMPNFSNLCSGNYFTVVRDSKGCLRNINVVVAEAAPIIVSSTVVLPICYNDCNGNIALVASGGNNANYQYSYNSGVFSNSSNFSNLCSGTQNFEVKDANGCTVLYSESLGNPLQIEVDTIYTVSSNCGVSNGEIAFSANGINPPFEFSLNNSPFNSTSNYIGLQAGAYTMRVKDQLGCINEVFYGINDVEMSGTLISITPTTCFNTNNGTIEVANVNGILPVSYSLDFGSPTNSGYFDQLEAEDHIIVLQDNGLCVYTFPFVISEPDSIFFQTTITPATCNGLNNGSLNINAISGGNGVYEFSLDGSPFQLNPTFNNLTAGLHNISIQDANGCRGEGSALITQPSTLILNAQGIDLLCNNDGSGLIQLIGYGGTGSAGTMLYNIDNSANFINNSGVFSSLNAGNYTAQVQDLNGCIASAAVQLIEPQPLVATFTVTATTCFESCDGAISVALSGGTAPYQYSINQGIDFQTNNVSNGLCSGMIQKLDRDFNNCIVLSSVLIPQPLEVTIASSITNASCGISNGEISISASGGVGGYQYSILSPASYVPLNNFTNLPATTYLISVKDLNNCSALDVVTITTTEGPTISDIVITEPLCFNDCNGSIEVETFGGTSPVSFSLNGSSLQTTTLFSTLCSGIYSLEIVDAGGCNLLQQVEVINPQILDFSHSFTNVTCNGGSTGSISFNASGGTLPYTYSVDDFSTFSFVNNIASLGANTYALQVRDARGCSASSNQIISEPSPITIATPIVSNASCNLICDGSISLIVSGGTVSTGNYNYIWSTDYLNSSNSSLTNICAGLYTVAVNDDNNCSVNAVISITEPVSLAINGVTKTNPTCNGVCNGNIQIISTSVFEYSLNDQSSYSTANIFSNLCAGPLLIYFKDVNGCFNTYNLELIQPQLLYQPELAQNASVLCNGAEFAMTSSALGGTPPYLYIWSTGDASDFLNIYLSGDTTITCTVVDFKGCVSNVLYANATIFPELEINSNSLVSVCPKEFNPMNAVTLSGGSRVDFQWLNSNSDTLAIGNSFTWSATATDSLTLVGRDECNSFDTLVVPFPVYELDLPAFVSENNVGCIPLTTQFTVSSEIQAGSTFQWSFGDGVAATGTTAAKTSELVGCYDVKLTMLSLQGCILDTLYKNAVCLNPNPEVDFDYLPANPTNIENVINFGNSSIGVNEYSWDFSTFGNSTEENPLHTFNDVTEESVEVCLTAISEQGCKGSKCKIIRFGEEVEFFAPNSFTPNQDLINSDFRPVWSKIDILKDYSLQIYNVWGQIVFETNDVLQGWDGTYKGKVLMTGTYQWVVKASGIDKKRPTKFTGNINLLN